MSFYCEIIPADEDDNILVINSGSSSIKLSVFRMDDISCHRLLDANFKAINSEKPKLEITSLEGEKTYTFEKQVTVKDSLQLIFDILVRDYKITHETIWAVGHRVVHGGSKYLSSVVVDQHVIDELEKITYLAPLHNKSNLEGIKGALNFFGKNMPQVAVFDTAFFASLPKVAATYAIDADTAEKNHIKRYGFHGISHKYLANSYAQLVKSEKSNIITLQLGNGCSMAAISEGIPLDTSMGFTPAEGLIMATRAGDIDAAIVEFLYLHEDKSPVEVMQLLNNRSGLLGVSKISSDMKTLLDVYDKNERAKLAVDMFCYRALKYLGAYMAVLGNVDAIIFSGGIGENSPEIRKWIVQGLKFYGVKIDAAANKKAIKLLPGDIRKISPADASVHLYVIATDENFLIAKEVASLAEVE
jgi:acetate kinase